MYPRRLVMQESIKKNIFTTNGIEATMIAYIIQFIGNSVLNLRTIFL